MTENIVNAYTIPLNDIQPGDVMMYVIKAMVVGKDAKGRLRYRLYRCPYDGPVVQGSRIGRDEMAICNTLFPSLFAVGVVDRY